MNPSRLVSAAVFVSLALALVAGAAMAQRYPAKPIRLIVPFPPGGGTDIAARTIANKLSESVKWTFVVENKPGAGGNLGVEQAVKSPADGYTLLIGQTSNLAINPTLYVKLPYDSLKDLSPVALIVSAPVVFVVAANSRYASLGDLLAAAKRDPGGITFASPGNGTVSHLAGELLQRAAGVKLTHVPYKGASQALTDTLGGQVQSFMSSVPSALSQIKGGRLRAIAVTSAKRSPELPDAPTIAESGYGGFEANTWYGLLAPAGTPAPVIARLNAEVIKVEPPAGDTLRAWQTSGVPVTWKLYSRSKKSLCLELRHPEARGLLLELVPSAAIFIESFRPGILEKMGLAPATLLARNPKLVVVRISGWGQDGPYSQRPGFGTLIEGMSGFASMNGFADREPVLPPMYLADSVAGLSGAAAAMIALREAESKGGSGQVIDLPLLEPLFNILGPQAANLRLTGKVKARTGNRSTTTAPRNAYRAKDGRWVCLSASIQKMAERLFRAIGRPELIDDPRYATNSERLRHAEELDAIIGAFIAQRTQAENVEFFEKYEVTIGPVYDIAQILEDPHVTERELVADYPDPDMGAFPMHHVTPRLSRTPGAIRAPAPKLGEHNRDLLAEIGVDEAAYAKLVAAGIACEGGGAPQGEQE